MAFLFWFFALIVDVVARCLPVRQRLLAGTRGKRIFVLTRGYVIVMGSNSPHGVR